VLLSFIPGVFWVTSQSKWAVAIDAPSPIGMTEGDVFVHLFEWTWNDVAQECESYLGPRGFRAVQISPPQEHIVVPEQGYPWWQRYQPVSYQLISRSGDRDQLLEMVQRCHAAGVTIYADAVINHMAAFEEGVGSAGTRFRRYNYPGLYSLEDFNPCRTNITNYQNAVEVTQCELVGLPDLNTSLPHVRSQLADYLVTLTQLGIDGFRIDAAKHIRNEDLAAILQLFYDLTPTHPYIYQEIIDPGNEGIRKQDYYSLGDVIEFEYGRVVGEAFLNVGDRTLADLENLETQLDLVPSSQALVFIDNHDKQRGHGGGGTYITYQDGAVHTLAMVFMLAYPYGKPQIMSSFRFDNPDQGPPTHADGHTQTVYTPDNLGCGTAWVCEHRQPEVAAMVTFRAVTQMVPEVTDWWSNDNNQIAFGRGDRGFVVINRADTPLTQQFQTQLPPGTYCEAIQQYAQAEKACAYPIQVQADGRFTTTVPEMSAIALHIDNKIPLE
jgi:alpha-amylase